MNHTISASSSNGKSNWEISLSAPLSTVAGPSKNETINQKCQNVTAEMRVKYSNFIIWTPAWTFLCKNTKMCISSEAPHSTLPNHCIALYSLHLYSHTLHSLLRSAQQGLSGIFSKPCNEQFTPFYPIALEYWSCDQQISKTYNQINLKWVFLFGQQTLSM